jgi:hypothetical protein
MRDRIHEVVEQARFDGPGEATRVSVVAALLLIPTLLGIHRAYDAETAAEVVPASVYARHTGDFATVGEAVVGLLFRTPLVAASDAIGRLWLAVAGWVPEPAAYALLAGLLAAHWLLALDWGWRTARDNREFFQAPTDAEVSR